MPQFHNRATLPAGITGLKAVLDPAFQIYPQPERTERQWAGWFSLYVDACGDLPTAALAAAMRAWVHSPESGKLPLPGQLRDAALKAEVPAVQALEKARAVIAYRADLERRAWDGTHRRIDPVVFKPDPPEVKAAAMAEYREARARAAAHAGAMRDPISEARRESLRAVQGQPAPGHHITQASLDAIRRQNGDPTWAADPYELERAAMADLADAELEARVGD